MQTKTRRITHIIEAGEPQPGRRKGAADARCPFCGEAAPKIAEGGRYAVGCRHVTRAVVTSHGVAWEFER